MSKLTNYLRKAREELVKVVWPSRQITTNHTLIVIGVSLGVAIFLGAVDWAFVRLLESFIK